jgi:hypothetical protein
VFSSLESICINLYCLKKNLKLLKNVVITSSKFAALLPFRVCEMPQLWLNSCNCSSFLLKVRVKNAFYYAMRNLELLYFISLDDSQVICK